MLLAPTYGAAQEPPDEATEEAVDETVEVAPEEPLPDLDAVLDRLDDMYQATSSHAEVTMTVVTEHYSRTLEIEGWSRGDDDSLMIIRAPAREAGAATLRTEEGLWNYAPRADRLMRIPSGLLSESWMGSHFTNDDLMRDSRYDDDYETTLERIDVAGESRLKATMIPHDDTPVVYTRIEFLLTEADLTPFDANYYDGDEMVRQMRWSDVRIVDDVPIPMVMVVQPMDRPDESTRVEYTELELNVPVDASLFTQRGLRRAAQRR